MAVSLQQQKENLSDFIERATEKIHLDELISQIDFGDLQLLLQDYVTNQASSEKVTKLHYTAGPLSDIIGTDCLKLAFDFLNYSDMCSMSGVNTFFNESIAQKRDILMNAELLESSTFIEYVYGDDWGSSFRIGHQLKYRYDYALLNRFSFKDLGHRRILKGDDMTVWEICNHFKLRTQLIPWAIDHTNTSLPWGTRGAFRDVSWGDTPMNDDYDLEWNVLNGTEETEYDDFDRLSPAVEIECRDRKWRDKFTADNLKGYLCEKMEKLLAVIPAFSGYREWDKQDDYSIGYFLQNEYLYDEQNLRAYTFEQLGSRGLLRGLDSIVYKLIQHFGFETKRYLSKEGGDVRAYPDRDDSGYFELQIDDDQPNWNPRNWQKTFGERLMQDKVFIIGINSAIQNYTSGSQIVYQITCPAFWR